MKTSEMPERLGKKYVVIEDYMGWWKIMEIYKSKKKIQRTEFMD